MEFFCWTPARSWWLLHNKVILVKIFEIKKTTKIWQKFISCLNSRGFHGDYQAVLMRGDKVLASKDLTLLPGQDTEVTMNLP